MYKKIYRNMCFLSLTTLALTSILIISACYTYFDDRIQTDIKNEAEVAAAFLNSGISADDTLKKTEFDMRYITVISPRGRIIFDNSSMEERSCLDLPEVKSALSMGEGSDKRYSPTADKTFYYYALKLSDGSVLRFGEESGKMPPVFYSILVSVLFVTALIYILTAIASMSLTENIVKPIRQINPLSREELDNVYEEIRPFLKRIANQNEEIGRQADKVTEQKARLRAIMDNINEGLVIIDKNSEVLSINKPALEIFGRSEESVKHRGSVNLTDKEQIHELIALSLRGEKSNVMFESGDRTYQIFMSPVYEKDIVSGTVLMLFDVTERTDSEKIRREFTANVSHELKTPLTTIHGYAQIIDSGIARPEDIGGFIKKIEKESSRLMALVNDIIELSHLDEGTSDSPKQEISLKTLASEVIDSLNQKSAEMNVSVNLTGEDTIIYANLSQISEMIYNLTDNAIKYNREGGKVDVTVGDKSIEIADTGIGIPEKYKERIFERFFRVDKSHSKKVNGTGLGLSIVKHIAKTNGAELKVESTLGKGSTFRVDFN